MTSPLAIDRGSKGPSPPFGVSPSNYGLFSHSPSSSWTPNGLLGSSPPLTRTSSSVEKSSPYNQAKKWWKRISYDSSLDAEEFTVGIVESVQQQERKSGAEAWSLRVQERVVERLYVELLAKYLPEDIPFHRIVYYKQAGVKVWESDMQRRRQSATDSETGDTPRSARHGFNAGPATPALPPLPLGSGKPSGGGAASDGDNSDSGNSAGNTVLAALDAVGADAGAPGAAAAPCEPRNFAELPEQCWMAILACLGVREVCVLARVGRYLRGLAASPDLWQQQYVAIFGEAAPQRFDAATVRRMCRRSELRAARWLQAQVTQVALGFASTACLQVDDTKVLSADGSAVRLWSHTTGRRIATLQGHTGRVTSVAFDEELIVSGCSQNVVKLWSMDDLKCSRTLRHHTGAITACLLLNGIPVSASEDGLVCLWDAAAGAPILELPQERPVLALDVLPQSGYLVSAGHSVDLWDVNTAQKLCTLASAGGDDEGDELEALGGLEGLEGLLGSGPPFTCVSYSGSLLAAGRSGEVCLFDPRAQASIGSITAARRHSSGGGAGAWGGSPCVGVQLDEWKLLAGFGDGSRSLALYDIRGALGGSARRPWTEAVQVFTAPGRITTFQAASSAIIAGIEGSECVAWSLDRPGSTPALAAGGLASVAEGEGAGGGAGAKSKKKALKVPKRQGRYPKRTTK